MGPDNIDCFSCSEGQLAYIAAHSKFQHDIKLHRFSQRFKIFLREKRASLPSPDNKDSDADSEKYDRDASQRDEHEVEV